MQEPELTEHTVDNADALPIVVLSALLCVLSAVLFISGINPIEIWLI